MLSRVANSLYWMSRYVERAEHTARVIDVNVTLMLDQSPAQHELRWKRVLDSLMTSLPQSGTIEPRGIVQMLTFDRTTPTSIIAMLSHARDNAREVRAQLSSEMWEQLNLVYLHVNEASADDIWQSESHALFRSVKEGLQLFHGLTDTTMPRSEGWHFLQVGRFIERASTTAALLDAYTETIQPKLAQPSSGQDYLDWVGLLKSRTAFEAYCQAYTADLQPQRIAAFLLLDPDFPHSVRFATTQVRAALDAITRLTNARLNGRVERLVGRLLATLEYGQIDELIADDLHTQLQAIQRQCAELHSLLHQLYFQPPLQTVVAS